MTLLFIYMYNTDITHIVKHCFIRATSVAKDTLIFIYLKYIIHYYRF